MWATEFLLEAAEHVNTKSLCRYRRRPHRNGDSLALAPSDELGRLGRSTMLTPLEEAVVDMLLEKQGEPFDSIRQQLSDATLRSSTA